MDNADSDDIDFHEPGDAGQDAPAEDSAGPGEDPFAPTPEFRRWVAGLPDATPAEIVAELRKFGYVGQERAVRAVALAAHRHVRRIKALFVQNVSRDELPPKQNLLFVGPTGCGKTYVVELLFREILKIPTTTVDITAYSETGYVGEDVTTVITRLLYAAQGDPRKAKVGMICLDEFDKLASSNNRAVFAGEGTTKDVSGLGVQRELLKMLESAVIAVPVAFSHNTYQQKPLVSTADIAFVACGAFSGLKGLAHKRSGAGIGFHAKGRLAPDEIAVQYDQAELEDTVIFQEYGFLPELIGRFSRIVPFDPLGRETLLEILDRNVIRSFRRELALAGIELELEPAVLDKIVDEAVRKQTGARGLRNALTLHLEDAAFEAYSAPHAQRIAVTLRDGAVQTQVEPNQGERFHDEESGP
jgi:ATP-dependent Clp protease ATP-binding subunit ClpX